jgi:hypothetical protein
MMGLAAEISGRKRAFLLRFGLHTRKISRHVARIKAPGRGTGFSACAN